MLEFLEKVSTGMWKRRRIIGVVCAFLMISSMGFILPENAKAQPPIRNPTWTSAALGNYVASLDMASHLSSDNELYMAVGTYSNGLHLFRASGGGVPEWFVSLNVARGLTRYMTDSVSISPHPYIAVGHDRNVSLYDIDGNELWDEECIPEGSWDVVGTAINDDATYVAAGGGNTICLFDATDGSLLSTASTNTTAERIAIVDMSQDGHYIAVSTVYAYPGNVSVFHNNNDVLELVMRSNMTDNLITLDMSDDGDYIVAGEDDSGNRGGSDARLYHWGDDDTWDWSDGDSYLTLARVNDVYAVAITHQGSYSSVGGTWGENGIMLDPTFQNGQEWETSVNWATAVVDHPLGVYGIFGQAMGAGTNVFFCRSTDSPGECYWRYPSNAQIYDVDAEGYFHVVAGNAAGYVHYWRNNPAPVAEFSWTPPEPLEGQDIQFTDESYDPDGRIVSWDWDFDGQGSSTNQNPVFAFGHAGTYPVTLNVTDNEGATDEVTHYVVVANVAPEVVVNATPSSAPEGTDVTFDGYFDDPSWLDNHTATWDFGDGTPTLPGTFYPGWGDTHHEMDEVKHAYGRAGVYQVTLTVQDDVGGIGNASVNVTIQNVPPTVTATINTTVTQEGAPFVVNGSFYDPSWNDTFEEVYFDFGYEDAMRGLGPIQDRGYWPPPGPGNVTHEVDPMDWIYGDDGNYTIYLNVTDEFGGSDSDSVYVVVENVAPTVINITVILHQNAPRTHGYWKHQCKIVTPKKDHPGIRQEWIDAIRAQSTVFTDVYTKDDVCGYLDPENPMTPMKRAKMQLMALWLNVVSGLLFIDSPLHHPNAPIDNSVAEFIVHAEYLIVHNPTDPNLNWVATIACDINEDADSQNDWQYIDPVVAEHIALAFDPGTDDLMFVWEDGLAITGKVIHYHFNNGIGFEPDYDPNTNQVKTPWGIYPFLVVDRMIVGYPPNYGSGVTAELVCLKDDDGGVSPQANKDCSDPWGSGMSGMGMILLGLDESVDWSFEFDIEYRAISGGFIIAEVEAVFTAQDPLVIPIVMGGKIEEQ